MTIVVFLGPSLPLAEARFIAPEAVFLPPARQGDLLSAVVNHDPVAIGLIDGEFLQSQSVWHKEILFALNAGVDVLGSSSIGALRAAETDRYGMRGIGWVYAQYSANHLSDDDEVALAHSPVEDGYRALSLPMVNIRATVHDAEDRSLITSNDAKIIIEVSKALYFPDRVWPRITDAAVAAGMSSGQAREVCLLLKSHYVDVKASDARMLLQQIAKGHANVPSNTEKGWLARTSGLDTLYNRERRVLIDGELVPLGDISGLVAISDPDFDRINFDALNRHLAGILGRLVGIEISEAETDAELVEFRHRHGLVQSEQLDRWLRANHVSRRELDQLMLESATCRALHRWVIYARFTERTTRILLDYLRSNNLYEPWAKKAAVQQRMLDKIDGDGVDEMLDCGLSELVKDQAAWTSFVPPEDLERWGELAGFDSESDMKRSFARQVVARNALLERLLSSLAEP